MSLLRSAFRLVLRQPAVSAPAIAMLSIGISITCVCFSLLEETVINAVPFPHASQLIYVKKQPGGSVGPGWNLSRNDFDHLKNNAGNWLNLAYESVFLSVAGDQDVRQGKVAIARVSPEFFEVLGVRPMAGRVFRPEEFASDAARAIIVTHRFWQTSMGGADHALGSRVSINQKPYTVIGIMPASLKPPATSVEGWIADDTPPLDWSAAAQGNKTVIGRLRVDMDIEVSAKELERIPQLAGDRGNMRFEVSSALEQWTGKTSWALNCLLIACLSIQFLACLNVGHLLMARRLNRIKELGVLIALGANLRSVLFGVLRESAVLSGIGIVVGICLAFLLLPAAAALCTSLTAIECAPRLSWLVLGVGCAVGIASSVLCAVLPSLVLIGHAPMRLLQGNWAGNRSTTTVLGFQQLMLVGQVAVAVLFASCFGLVVREVHRLSSVDTGFRPERLSYAVFDLGKSWSGASAQSVEHILERIRALPGVESVAMGSTPLLTGATMQFKVSARTESGEWLTLPPVAMQTVSSSYFTTLGTPVIHGRSFTSLDVRGAPRVAIANKAFSQLVWGKENAVGNQIDLAAGNGEVIACEIVEVVGDTRETSIGQAPVPMLYFSHLQRAGSGHLMILMRRAPGSHAKIKELEKLVTASASDLRWNFSTDVELQVDRALQPSRTRAMLLGLLSALVLILAAGGMYAAARFNVNSRAREFGVRAAMGARVSQLAWLVYAFYGRLALIGGLLGAWLGVIAEQELLRMSPDAAAQGGDSIVYLTAPVICLTVVLIAVAEPVWRAATADPTNLLKAE
jgi:putative ABC transport system permease protein